MPSIAITGATGYMGGAVAKRLATDGISTLLVVRDPSRAPDLPGAEVRVASGYGDGDGMRAALAGADTLYLVPAHESVDRLEQHKTAVDAAVAAGVGRIVYLSFVDASADSTFTLGRQHYATEQHIRDAGVAFAFVRMNFYQDVLPLFVLPEGVIRGPAGDGRLRPVARDDLADVSAAVIVGGHDGVHEVSGPEALTMAEVARILTVYGGKPIRFVDETREEAYASRAGYGAEDWQVEAWVSTYEAIRDGELDVPSDAIERLAGHAPITFAEFVRAHPDCLDHVE